MKDFLPLVGALRQLETLALANWAYTMADIAAIHHLTKLQNLKVILAEIKELPLGFNDAIISSNSVCAVEPDLQSKGPCCFANDTSHHFGLVHARTCCG